MVRLTFNQSKSELMVRAAATILFRGLERQGAQEVSIAELAQHAQYGFTASAALAPVGPKLVRITDLQDGKIVWESVPYCECAEPEKYLLRENDILFARTGATTGKTHLVRSPEAAVFASYLIRLRPKPEIDPGYLYAFFQSENYWSQISEEKEGSAQPNVNGDKLSSLNIPRLRLELQHAIAEFVRCVRRRQDGDSIELPKLPEPLAEQRQIVARVEELAAKIGEAQSLRNQAAEEAEVLVSRATAALVDEAGWQTRPLGELLVETPRNGLSPQPEAESGNFRMLRINAVSSAPTRFVDLTAFKRVQVSDENAKPFVLQHDDVFIVRYNGDINRVAKPGIYKGTSEPCVVFPDKLMRLRPYLSEMLPDFLVFALSSQCVRDQVEEIGKTTAGNIGISGSNAKSFKVSVPPLFEQQRIVTYLDNLQSKVDEIKNVQAATSAALDALMPSILDKAFRGEL